MLPAEDFKKTKRITSSTSCRHLDVNDYDRIIHGFPPILIRKTKALERNIRDDISFTLPSIPSNQTTKTQLQSRKSIEKLHKNKNPDEIDIVTLIENRIRNLKQNAFLYLTYAYRSTSEFFTPYSFIEVPYSKVDKNGFFTISKEGFTFWSPNENHFTKLDDWYSDYLQYCVLIKIKLFQKYRIWKSFTVWNKAIKWKKFNDSKMNIGENLFFANPTLHATLLHLRKYYCELVEKKFTDIKILQDWHLFYFLESQTTQFEETRNLLDDFRNDMEIRLFDACYNAIKEKGFSPEDEILNCKSIKKLKEQISFTERAKKLHFCSRLTNFLRLADFITINLLSTIMFRSFEDLTRVFQIHGKFGPNFAKLKSSSDFDLQLEEPRPVNVPQSPFLIAELVLKAEKIEIDPSKDVALYVMSQMFNLFSEAIHNVRPFQSDVKFKLFTEPSIVSHQEDRLYKTAPSVDFILDNDISLNNNKKIIINIINIAYDKIELYIKRFDTIRQRYKEDLQMDKEQLKNEKDLDALISYCERFTYEIESLDGILPEINLGLIRLKQATFREKIIPQCRELLSILENHLPKLAKETVMEVREKAENLMTKLTSSQKSAQSFVNFLDFLDKCPAKIEEEIEKVLGYALRAFQIMRDFKISIDDEEKHNFVDTEEFLQQLKLEFELKINTRQRIIDQLALSLQKDIEKIFVEIDLVNVEVMKPELIDENANSSQVRENLSELMEKLHECQEDSQKIQRWQKQFKIDVTSFDSLDVVFQEVRLRQCLWDSLQQWKDCYEELIEIPFNKLNMQQVVELNTKILKNCGMLEKNLPRNEIVPRLKADCEEFKEKIPILQCLRCIDLKPRHWLKIEQTLDRKLLGNDNLTLYTFEDAGAFEGENAMSIQDITGQATGEAKLEEALKKVDTVWKALELSVVPYRDQRDIFILTGIDELQSVLDDSNVTIATIASSKHIGTLKPRIDEWIRQLEIFSKTFEEWMQVQKQWIYLEAIFSSPDIQQQLPQEAKSFIVIDKSWKDIMKNVSKNPLALPAMTQNGYYEVLHRNNVLLEQISRCLEAYLEVKRVAFSRFYFLSNTELLEILAQTKNIHAVQPHLRKCFDAIAKIEFGLKDGDKRGEKVQSNDILSMISPEGEKIQFTDGLKARGSIEDWLSKVEVAMFAALKRCMKYAHESYKERDCLTRLKENPSQILLAVSQQQWAEEIHNIFDYSLDKKKNLIDFEQKLIANLNTLVAIARTNITPLLRKVLSALITIDFHAKETVTDFIQKNVLSSDDFNWIKMLRYYWKSDSEVMEVKMALASSPYFYEYLGATGVLVITPLTDRCFLSLMQALQMELSGSIQGPAGTGKTETVKYLAKALAVQCIVFNCSNGIDHKMLGRLFSGLAQSGSWCCFDEFNLIKKEVLSVSAQFLITIKNAKVMNMKRFIFEGREIKLVNSCATFITMNPDYTSRSKLPDNLKALFRPVSMMIPNYILIAEVILYSEGFLNAKTLAQKMIQTYKLCAEQLSQQSHYDFGMGAVKSVLKMAASFKRATPDRPEEQILISALRDSNLPKFLKDDEIVFNGIISDLFPDVEILLTRRDDDLQRAVKDCMIARNLQPLPSLVTKCIELYETMRVRWGLMLVGSAATGKTSTLHTLADAMIKLFNDNNKNYRRVRTQTINPKSVSIDELYGYVNVMNEWKNGLLGMAIKSAVEVTAEENYQWIIMDGIVDPTWIENLNTLLDDNKCLCLANSERIKLTPYVRMIFEVQDLEQASPATVSRCGMIYFDSTHLTWNLFVKSWLNTIDNEIFDAELKNYVEELFIKYFEDIFSFARKKCAFIQNQVEISKVDMLCTILKSLLMKIPNMNLMEECDIKAYISKLWIWATLFSIGSNCYEASRVLLEIHVRRIMEQHENIDLPETSLWEYRLNPEEKMWEKWDKIMTKFVYSGNYNDLFVPTSDTVRFGYVSEILLKANHPILYFAEPGTGKSVFARELLSRLSSEGNMIPVFINFSAQTSSIRTQEMIENRLEKRKKTLLGAPISKKVIIFIDDVNMPKQEIHGAIPAIELLRQFLDFNGWYDRDKMYWKDIVDLILTAACSPPGGSRNHLSPRFMRHFSLLSFPSPNTNTLRHIFGEIIVGFFSEFSKTIWGLAEPIVKASVALYEKISQELLPTPSKSHYLFNMRDLSKCIQGLVQANSTTYTNQIQIMRLFYHEALRTFHDRLVTKDDRVHFKNLLNETCRKYFDCSVIENGENLLYGDFMTFGKAREYRVYEEIKDMQKLKNILFDYLHDYNALSGRDIHLILFQDAIEHILRLARILRSERGNGLLVGKSGLGKQSLARLASNINNYQCMQIELKRGYDYSSFREDLRKCYTIAGNNQPIVFLLNDTQILQEEFLEDINNVLNSGDVPNLFEGDEFEKIILSMRVPCVEANYKDQSRDGVYDFFISRVRSNLHVVLTMNPIGNLFRRRLRMFPSLVNCCIIDWYETWPQEALYSVALGSLQKLTDDEYQCDAMASVCVMIHESVEKASETYYLKAKRHHYTTPSSYIELLRQYHVLLKKKIHLITTTRNKIANGLDRILETNEVVQIMNNELKVIVPIMEQKSQDMKDTVARMEKDNAQADIIRKIVLQDEAEAKIKAMETQEIADDAAKDLEIVMPQLRTAQEGIKALNKNDINEIRLFTKPPRLVVFVLEAVLILLNYKNDWNTAKQIMGDMNFLKKLQEYNANNIPEAIIKKLKPYVEHKDFQPAIVEKVSKTARSMCAWVVAINRYAEVYKDVEPKIKKRDSAEMELNHVMYILKQKQNQLAEAEAKIQSLKDDLDRKQKEMHEIQLKYDLNNKRLTSADRLLNTLSDEEIRWRETVEKLDNDLYTIPGDVLICSGYIAYLGAFSIEYRNELCTKWIAECRKLNIPCSDNFEFIESLGDPYQLREWNLCGLPREKSSLENGLIATTQSSRWPLMIDPHEQANNWIRNMEKENNLIVTKMTDPHLVRSLENAITQGYPILLEDVDEYIDPSLHPVLVRSFFNQGGRIMLHYGDTDIEYDSNFKLYMTTKLPKPHYQPNICIKVNLINFSVSITGLEDQLLSDIARVELPKMEKERNDLIVSINSDKQQMQQLEDKILKLLFLTEGNILDDEETLETLNESKEFSMVLSHRLVDKEKSEETITIEREKYRKLASKGAVLFFTTSSLIEIDPMYQISLRYFKQIFSDVIEEEAPKMEFEERLKYLSKRVIKAIYMNISRGIFEKHKLIYSFLIATTLQKHEHFLNDAEVDFLLRGDGDAKFNEVNIPAKPEKLSKIDEKQWNDCIHLQDEFEDFDNLTKNLDKTIEIKLKDQTFILTKGENSSLIKWNENLTSFKKLILISVLKSEKLMLAISCYINEILGREFVESNVMSLSSIYNEMSAKMPLIFILSSGNDALSSLQKLAIQHDFGEKFHSISLGQEQGLIAEAILNKSKSVGHWVYLQNCHLSISWLPKLEEIVRDMMLDNSKIHPNFRLFLSSMPLKSFPVSILQNSIKLTTEQPKGLKSNLTRSLMNMNEETFEIHILDDDWRKVIFGLCMFHGIVTERRKFGSLGFNMEYEFNDDDCECALKILNLYVDREYRKEIPWQALEINCEITYGGRITDDFDQKCMKTILNLFSSVKSLNEDYKYSTSGVYYCPSLKKLADFKTFVNELPYKDTPEIFGLHENASIVYEVKEADFFLQTILASQAKVTSVVENSNDENVLEIIQKIKTLLKYIVLENMNTELTIADSKDRTSPLTTVLLHETARYNNLLKLIHNNLSDLEKGIKGIMILSETLEEIYEAFLSNKVPLLWLQKGFSSTKSLASWINDFALRIEHLQSWIIFGQPNSFWISGFFYPQSFLSAVLMNHARKHNKSINLLKFDFEVMNTTVIQGNSDENDLKIPIDGVYIHGLFLEAGKWDKFKGGICDADDGVLSCIFPVLWLKPCENVEIGERFEAPLYKTQMRTGVLSTTGHSTNFVMAVLLKSRMPPDFWILRGTALFTLLTN